MPSEVIRVVGIQTYIKQVTEKKRGCEERGAFLTLYSRENGLLKYYKQLENRCPLSRKGEPVGCMWKTEIHGSVG